MPLYRSSIRYTEEQKRNLRVDVKRIPEWERELRSIEDNFRKYDLQKVVGAAILIQEMKEKLYFGNSIRSPENERKSLEKWKEYLTTERLAVIATDYSAPYFLHNGLEDDFVGKIRSVLEETEKRLAEFKSSGVTNSFWISMLTSKVDVDTVRRWQVQREEYLVYSRNIPKIQEAVRLLDRVRNESKIYADRIAKINNCLYLAELKKDAVELFERKHGNTFAKAAAVDKQTRSRATSIKRLVEKTSHCPYCGSDLGRNPHLDHIYPVSKGGLSIVENLVWCCAQCNSVKADKGLMQFLKERRLPVEETLNRLHALGKHV